MSSSEVSARLGGIRSRFPELKDISSAYMHNYKNAHYELVNVFRRMDSDIRDDFLLKAYESKLSFEEMQEIDYFDDQLTNFGEHLVEIRFCCGYIGNLVQGHKIPKEQCLALIYAYDCYWHEGDDFLLGNVVENLLRRIPDSDEWGWPADAEFKGKEKDRQLQWLAYTVAKEMKELARYHRNKQPAFDRTPTPKPERKDFRAVMRQIDAAAKAKRAMARAPRAPKQLTTITTGSRHGAAEVES